MRESPRRRLRRDKPLDILARTSSVHCHPQDDQITPCVASVISCTLPRTSCLTVPVGVCEMLSMSWLAAVQSEQDQSTDAAQSSEGLLRSHLNLVPNHPSCRMYVWKNNNSDQAVLQHSRPTKLVPRAKSPPCCSGLSRCLVPHSLFGITIHVCGWGFLVRRSDANACSQGFRGLSADLPRITKKVTNEPARQNI